jgi:hypothetical protein
VEVYSEDYPLIEYGLTEKALKRAVRNLNKKPGMKKPHRGTEPPGAFAVEWGASWKGWAKHRTDSELEEVNQRLRELVATFGKPHAV